MSVSKASARSAITTRLRSGHLHVDALDRVPQVAAGIPRRHVRLHGAAIVVSAREDDRRSGNWRPAIREGTPRIAAGARAELGVAPGSTAVDRHFDAIDLRAIA